MENGMVKEAADILKKLSLPNQTYFMTLVRLAEAAENSAKGRETIYRPCSFSEGTNLQQTRDCMEPAKCFPSIYTNNAKN